VQMSSWNAAVSVVVHSKQANVVCDKRL